MRFLSTIFLLFCQVVLNACSATPPTMPYQSYEAFLQAIREKRTVVAVRYVTEDRIKAWLDDQYIDKFTEAFPFLTALPSVIVNELGHYQWIDDEGSGACLTVIGIDPSGAEMYLDFAFKQQSGKWKIDLVHIYYLLNGKKAPDYARCPKPISSEVENIAAR